MSNVKYKANFMTVPLSLPESRIVASLLLNEVSKDEWDEAILVENVLQRRSKSTAATQGGMIRNRLNTMGPDLWELIRDGSVPIATHATFAALLKFSPLLGDFLDLIVREQFRRFEKILRPIMWDSYMDGCRERDPTMPVWSEATHYKLRQAAFKILAEAGYLGDTRNLELKPVQISPEVMKYLMDNQENYVSRCIQVTNA